VRIMLVTWQLQPIFSNYRQNSQNFCPMRQNRHYQIFWLMCNWVCIFGFGLDIGVHNFKFLDTDWIWSLWKNFGSNPIAKFPYPYTTGLKRWLIGIDCQPVLNATHSSKICLVHTIKVTYLRSLLFRQPDGVNCVVRRVYFGDCPKTE